MIMYVYANQINKFPIIANSMFQHRAAQFKDRLGWKVSVDKRGWEVDMYDSMNPIYIIWINKDGTHGGSVRLMPTIGRTMINDHFLNLMGGIKIQSPLIWECTRFCLAPNANSSVAAALLAAGMELGLRFGLEQAIGVIYTRTISIYRRIGSEPNIIGSFGSIHENISVGLWDVSVRSRNQIAKKAGIPLKNISHWFESSFEHIDSYTYINKVAA